MNALAKSVVGAQLQPIQPLSQSRQADMACQCLYVRKHVIAGAMAESEAAARGIEVHQILATYINRLMKTRRSTDLGFLDCLINGSGNSEVVQALKRFRDNHAFNPEQVLGTELHISLDEGFKPIEPASLRGSDQGRAARTPAAYEGTLDLVLLPSMTEAEIHDWKTYYQIIDPDTFQSKFYPLLLMCLNPALQRVRFVLEFIRYGASRSVEYTRQDVPQLKELAERERTRQRKLHEVAVRDRKDLKASPGRHCTWCPLLLNGCPVSKTNPYAQMTAEERLRFALWLQEAEEQNTKVLKDLMLEHGPIGYRDENETEYLADFVSVERKFYPFEGARAVLDEWRRAHPEDRAFVNRLTVSGLSSPLKAKKRSALAAQFADLADIRVEAELRMGRAKVENDHDE